MEGCSEMMGGLGPEDQACQDLPTQAEETAGAQFPEAGMPASSRSPEKPHVAGEV